MGVVPASGRGLVGPRHAVWVAVFLLLCGVRRYGVLVPGIDRRYANGGSFSLLVNTDGAEF